MDLPVSDIGPIKDTAHTYFICSHCDVEIVHKIAQFLLTGLATACVESTTGDPFRYPAMIAVDFRKEMIDYLTHRSETYVSDLILSQESSSFSFSEPSGIVSDFIEEFSASKRSILSRVSGWILSDIRDDRIDKFVHEMDTNRFWMINRREAVAEVLLRNLDYRNDSHCSVSFDNELDLEMHKSKCGFRLMTCMNEGCKAKFCAVRESEHGVVCAYKLLPCEQNCGEMVLRREMDRHCVTVCGMKLMNCPFYQIGCESGIPRCRIEQHCSDELHRHLVCVLPTVYGDEEGSENLWIVRAEALQKAQSGNQLAKALNVRSLISAIKILEAGLIKEQDVR